MGYARVLAEEIYRKYKRFNDGFVPNGACIHIAYEVYMATGAMPVAGYLHMCTIKRSHWWNETEDGELIDLMGDEYKEEVYFEREEVHRDFQEFIRIWNKRYHLNCDQYLLKTEEIPNVKF